MTSEDIKHQLIIITATSKEGLTRGILVSFASLDWATTDVTLTRAKSSNVSHALQPRLGGAALPTGSARADSLEYHSAWRRSATSTKEQLVATYRLFIIVQELCESRGGRPGLFVLTSLLVSVDVKNY